MSDQRNNLINAADFLNFVLTGARPGDDSDSACLPVCKEQRQRLRKERVGVLSPKPSVAPSPLVSAALPPLVSEEPQLPSAQHPLAPPLGSDCVICTQEYADPEEEVVVLPCGHVFHEACIDTWFERRNSCPVCRAALETDDVTYLRSIGLDEEADELEVRIRSSSRDRFRSLLATLASQPVMFMSHNTIFSVRLSPPSEEDSSYCAHCFSDLPLGEPSYRCTECPQRFCCECYEQDLFEHDRTHQFDYSDGESAARRWGQGGEHQEDEDTHQTE